MLSLKSKHPTLRKMTFLLLSIIISVNISLSIVGKKIMPSVLTIAYNQTNKITTLITSLAVEKTLNNLSIDKIIEVTYKDNNTPSSVMFNTNYINQILTTSISFIYQQLRAIEEGKISIIEEEIFYEYNKDLIKKGIIYEIPLGMIFNNPLLANIGPKFPVKIIMTGDIKTNLKSIINQYGINNAMIEIKADLIMNMQVIIPTTTTRYDNCYTIPIAMKVIQGDIPTYYQGSNNIGSEDSFVIPLT